MGSWTPEPWVWEPDTNSAGALRAQASEYRYIATDIPQEEGERAVACVNALAGLNPDDISDVVRALEDLCGTNGTGGLVEAVADQQAMPDDFYVKPLEQARTALRKLRGER